MRKKAILLKEGINLVVAIVVIVLLIILVTKIIGIFTSKHELEQARATLNQLIIKINNMEEGDVSSYMVLSPRRASFPNTM